MKLAPPKEIQKGKDSQKDVTTRASENKFGVSLKAPKEIEKVESTRATMPLPPKKEVIEVKKEEKPK